MHLLDVIMKLTVLYGSLVWEPNLHRADLAEAERI